MPIYFRALEVGDTLSLGRDRCFGMEQTTRDRVDWLVSPMTNTTTIPIWIPAGRKRYRWQRFVIPSSGDKRKHINMTQGSGSCPFDLSSPAIRRPEACFHRSYLCTVANVAASTKIVRPTLKCVVSCACSAFACVDRSSFAALQTLSKWTMT